MTNNRVQPSKEIVVDNEKYIVQLYSPTDGLTLHAKLLTLFGEPLMKMISMFKGLTSFDDLKSMGPKDLDMDGAGEALQRLFQNLPPDQFVPLIKEILSSTFVHSTKVPVNDVFETQFLGRYMHIYKLVAKTLGAQYPDFLSVLRKRANVVSGVPASELNKTGT